jgi:hypothetical protein
MKHATNPTVRGAAGMHPEHHPLPVWKHTGEREVVLSYAKLFGGGSVEMESRPSAKAEVNVNIL